MIINGQHSPFHEHHLLVVPAGTTHNIVNTGSTDLKLFTIYTPPQHKPGLIQQTKKEADVAKA